MCEIGPSDELRQRAQDAGVACEFTDWHAVTHSASANVITKVIAALGADAPDPWPRALPDCVVIREDLGGQVDVHVRSGADAHVRVKFEDGTQLSLTQVDNWLPDREAGGYMVGEASFALPAGMPTGYHALALLSEGQEFETKLIVTPSLLPLPAALDGRRCWGFAVQLYSVPSRLSWGIGDFSDLGVLAVWAAGRGADYVLVNPLHAPALVPPVDPSPYAPASRRFISPLYIRPEATLEYAYAPSEVRADVDAAQRDIAERASSWSHLRRDEVWQEKCAALRRLFVQSNNNSVLACSSELNNDTVPNRRAEFEQFRAQQGQTLEDFATWCSLSQELGQDWRTWDEQFRSPGTPEVAAFREQNTEQISFFCWLQFVAAEQLRGAQQLATQAGMAVGIVTDLAVGVQASSADTWASPDVFAHGVSIGAPPDDYNQMGQEWGMPPLNPRALAATGYAPLIEVLRSALSGVGGVRIDHMLGAFRQWWVPNGTNPQDGVYVNFDHEAFVGIIALEAARAGALVVGEDLGTLEPWVREYLVARGLLGTTVLWFESEQGSAKPPETWRELTLASVTTHDLPPTVGYLNFEQVYLRHRLGLLTNSLEAELTQAEQEQRYWLDYVAQHPFEASDETSGTVSNAATTARLDDDTEAQVLGLYHALTLSPCRVLNVALVDAVGDHQPQNQPGTIDEYPNWRVWLGGPAGERLYLEDVLISRRARRLAGMVQDRVAAA
ncbi:MAG: 4-alpha-glucanotransferase [Propionibacteriaceae bacterium]|jgi:4-alpha-glucanotransferase|nr:4-alpha-glucanotransferase [Propionibacteriaceae bacterium]